VWNNWKTVSNQIKFALTTQPTPAIPNKAVPIGIGICQSKGTAISNQQPKDMGQYEKATRKYVLRAEGNVL